MTDQIQNPGEKKLIVEDEKKYIDILLREYDTLRNELRQKDASLVQSLSVVVALMTFIIKALLDKQAPWCLYIICLLPPILLGFFSWYFVHAPKPENYCLDTRS